MHGFVSFKHKGGNCVGGQVAVLLYFIMAPEPS